MISSSFSSPCSQSGSYFSMQSNPAGRGNPAGLPAPGLAGVDQCFHCSLPRLAPSLSSPVAIQPLAVMWSCLPCFAGGSPAHGFWALSKKPVLTLEGTFCHPGYGTRGNDVGCSSASAMPDIFQSVLKEEFSLVSHLSQLVVWVPVRVGSLCVPHMSHSWLGHGFQKHTSDQT